MDKSLAQQLGKISEAQNVPEELVQSYLSKLQFCSKKLDFNDENKEIKEKNDRLFFLQQISDLLQEGNAYPALVLPHFEQFMSMIESNIFRPLPVQKKQVPTQEPDLVEDNMYLLASWSHLQPVYDIFLQSVVSDSMDIKVLMQFITKSFIQRFLTLFDSTETREREYVKNLYHRIYSKLIQKRRLFRKSIGFVFTNLVQEGFIHNGMPELLDILASIITGFAVPLKEEHTTFFRQVFLPLYKVPTSHLFHEQLMRCSILFYNKMPELSHDLVEALLKYWPFANSSKELMFLGELVEVLEACEMDKIKLFVEKLFKRLIKCISGPHLQISDRAMCFFENEYFLAVLRQYKAISFPLIVPVIHKIADTHWHAVLQESLTALRAILREMDPIAYDKALQMKNIPTLYLVKDMKKRGEERQAIEDRWNDLVNQIKKNKPNFEVCQLAYTEKKVVGMTNRLQNGNVVF